MRASNYWKLDLTACIVAVFLYAYMFVSVDSTTGGRNYYSVLRVTAMGIVSYGLAAAYFRVKDKPSSDSWKYICILGSIIDSAVLLAVNLWSDGIERNLALIIAFIALFGSIQMMFLSGLAILVTRLFVYLFETCHRLVSRLS